MSVKQYLRKASLIIGPESGEGLDLSDLRFTFQITRGDIQTPNEANVRVYNVSPDTALKLQASEFSRIIVQAGYEGNFGIIFDGTIKQRRVGRENQTDTYLDITAADGDAAYNFSMTAISLEAGPMSGAHNSVGAILKNMVEYGIASKPGYLPELPNEGLKRGKVIFGTSRDALRNIALNTSTSWSIQDGQLVMIPLSTYLPGEIPVLNSDSGVVGLPEQTVNGIQLTLLMNPNIKIGQAVKLDNASIQNLKYSLELGASATNLTTEQNAKINGDGLYYVMMAEHRGDTRGQDWYTELTCLAIDATVPTSYITRFSAANWDKSQVPR